MPSAAENLGEKISKKRHYAIEPAFDTLPQAYCLPGRSIAVAYPEDFVPGYYRFALYCLFFEIFGCTRHSPNKFGSALACTKIGGGSA